LTEHWLWQVPTAVSQFIRQEVKVCACGSVDGIGVGGGTVTVCCASAQVPLAIRQRVASLKCKPFSRTEQGRYALWGEGAPAELKEWRPQPSRGPAARQRAAERHWQLTTKPCRRAGTRWRVLRGASAAPAGPIAPSGPAWNQCAVLPLSLMPMPRDGAIIFNDLIGKLDLLRVECPKCGRNGGYRLADLIMRYGRDEKIFAFTTTSPPTALEDRLAAIATLAARFARICQR
jgi:hypothetical protein